MSNLTLKTMNYKELMTLPEDKKRKIGYKTYAKKSGDAVWIYHHESAIGLIRKNRIEITTAGWNSDTTKQRLDLILAENFGWDFVRVVKRDYITSLHVRNSNVYMPFRDAVVWRDGTVEVRR